MSARDVGGDHVDRRPVGDAGPDTEHRGLRLRRRRVFEGDVGDLRMGSFVAGERSATIVDQRVEHRLAGVRIDGLGSDPGPRDVKPHERGLHEVLGLKPVARRKKRRRAHESTSALEHVRPELLVAVCGHAVVTGSWLLGVGGTSQLRNGDCIGCINPPISVSVAPAMIVVDDPMRCRA